MDKEEIFFITGNQNKLREVKQILDCPISNVSADLIEIQSTDVNKVVKHKLIEAYKLVEKPVIVEDTGFYIRNINGFPGALIKFYFRDVGEKGICTYHKFSKVNAKTVMGFYDGLNEPVLVEGSIMGHIPEYPRGNNGFGWDRIFVPDGYDKTFAEMNEIEKNSCSMRRMACDNLLKYVNPEKYQQNLAMEYIKGEH